MGAVGFPCGYIPSSLIPKMSGATSSEAGSSEAGSSEGWAGLDDSSPQPGVPTIDRGRGSLMTLATPPTLSATAQTNPRERPPVAVYTVREWLGPTGNARARTPECSLEP